MKKCTFVTDWLDVEFDPEEGWIEGLPLKLFLEPDAKMAEMLKSLKVKVVNELACQGMSEVEISGNKKDVEWFENAFTGCGDECWDEIVAYCEEWIGKNYPIN